MERSEASSSAVNLRKQRMEPKKSRKEATNGRRSLKTGAPLFHDKERPVDSAASQVRSVLG